METRPYILGLDLGTNSLGWACIDQSKGAPSRLLAQGVRIFEAGLEIDPSGKGTPLNLERRTARQRRRQHDRRKRRILKVRRILQSTDMLPANRPEHNDTTWKKLLAKNPSSFGPRLWMKKSNYKSWGFASINLGIGGAFFPTARLSKKMMTGAF